MNYPKKTGFHSVAIRGIVPAHAYNIKSENRFFFVKDMLVAIEGVYTAEGTLFMKSALLYYRLKTKITFGFGIAQSTAIL